MFVIACFLKMFLSVYLSFSVLLTGFGRRGDGVARRMEDGERLSEDGRVLAVPSLPDRPRLHPHGMRRPLKGHQVVVRRTTRGSRPRAGQFFEHEQFLI